MSRGDDHGAWGGSSERFGSGAAVSVLHGCDRGAARSDDLASGQGPRDCRGRGHGLVCAALGGDPMGAIGSTRLSGRVRVLNHPRGSDHASPLPSTTLPPIKFPGALDLSVIGETRRAWGGLRVGGIATVATAIGADLAERLPRQNKKQREGLALLVATALDVRDVNLMELAAALPRAAARLDMRYQWISRLLGNALIDTDEVIAPFAREVLARAGAQAHT